VLTEFVDPSGIATYFRVPDRAMPTAVDDELTGEKWAPARGHWLRTIFDGRFNGMRTTIDGAGRLVVPKKIREAVQLTAGSELEVRLENGMIQLEPVTPQVKLKKRGQLLVATRPGQAETLTQEMVDTTRDSIRRERARSTMGETGRP
jgi:AbrB family looped-hinge helix DNA binding protein